jgi:hypothetical protein
MTTKKSQIENHLKRIRQFNISDELVGEVELFLEKNDLNEEQAGVLCTLIERITTQHYVRQLLKTELK